MVELTRQHEYDALISLTTYGDGGIHFQVLKSNKIHANLKAYGQCENKLCVYLGSTGFISQAFN